MLFFDWESATDTAEPGNVQTAIDRVYESGGGTVRLNGGELYEPSQTWQVKSNVVLDCNAAVITPTTDDDLMHVHPSGYVLHPRVHLPSFDWSGTVFTFDTQYGTYHPEWYRGPYRYYGAGVLGGYTRGVRKGDRPGNCRVFHLDNRGERSDAAMAWIHCAHHDSYFVKTVADLHARTDPWWINGNYLSGMHWMHETCLRTRGGGQIAGNTFEFFQTQAETYSKYLWDIQKGNFNTLRGMFWDTGKYDRIVRIPDEDRANHNLVRSNWIHDVDFVEDLGNNYVVTNRSYEQLDVS